MSANDATTIPAGFVPLARALAHADAIVEFAAARLRRASDDIGDKLNLPDMVRQCMAAKITETIHELRKDVRASQAELQAKARRRKNANQQK